MSSWGLPVVAADPSPSPSEVYLRHCAEARRRLDAGEAAGAVEQARAALGVLPRGLEAQRVLGLALLEQGELRPAQHAFQGALACDPLDLVALVGVAEAKEQQAGPAEAEDEWRRAWEAEPGVPEVEGRYVAARSAAGALDQHGAAPPLTRVALARIYLRGELYEHAATEARALLARFPERDDVHLTLAEAYWKLGDVEAAASAAGALLERLPDCVEAHLLTAAYWQTIGRDIGAPMARLRMVDAGGTIAARLFADREPPPLLEAEAAAAPWQPAPEVAFQAAVAEVTPSDEADTQPLRAVAGPGETTDSADETPVEPAQLVALEPVDEDDVAVGDDEAADEAPVGRVVEEEAGEEELDTEEAAVEERLVADELLGAEGEEGEQADETEETAAERVTAENAEAGPTVDEAPEKVRDAATTTGDSVEAALAAGDAAMRSRDYLAAMRAYGAALRRERGHP